MLQLHTETWNWQTAAGLQRGIRSIRGYLERTLHTLHFFKASKSLENLSSFDSLIIFALLTEGVFFFCCTSMVPGLAVVGSLTGSRHRVPQGADSRVLDAQRCAHQQQHCLPGALHLAPRSYILHADFFFPGEPQKHTQWDFILNAFFSFKHARLSAAVEITAEAGTAMLYKNTQ